MEEAKKKHQKATLWPFWVVVRFLGAVTGHTYCCAPPAVGHRVKWLCTFSCGYSMESLLSRCQNFCQIQILAIIIHHVDKFNLQLDNLLGTKSEYNLVFCFSK
jgi:hypothetical protein